MGWKERMVRKGILGCIGAVCLCQPFVAGKDDDFAFAKSLANKGYVWLAERELAKLEKSSDERERILRFVVAAEMYKRAGELKKMIDMYNKFLEASKTSADSQILAARREVEEKLWEKKQEALRRYINDIEEELHKDKPDEARLTKLRAAAQEIGKDLVDYRRRVFKDLDEKASKLNVKEEVEIECAKSKLFLARSLYYYSFAFKGGDEVERRKILEEAHNLLKELGFIYENVILIPYFDGLCLWELKRYKEAAVVFKKCNTRDYFLQKQAFYPIRKVAYQRTVQCYYKIREYRACAEEANNYLLDFPSEEDRRSYHGQVIRITLAKAISEMSAADYKELKEKCGWKKDQHAKAVEIAEAVEAEGGYKRWEAREFLRKQGRGYLRDIIEGVAQYHAKNYREAISFLQKGLKEAPSDISLDKKLTKLAQAWYYLGFAYYHLGMKLPAVIAFKEGTTRFMGLYKKHKKHLSDTQKQWYLENKKNWKTVAGLYYKDTRSQLAVDIFKEALISYAQGEGGEKEVGKHANVYVNLAIILAQNEEYADALKELEQVGPDSPSYLKALRLKGKFTWALYRKEGKKDKELAKKAFAYFAKLRKLLTKEIAAVEDKEEKASLIDRRAEVDAFVVAMMYGSKEYREVAESIDSFWKTPPRDDELAFATGRYQVYAAIRLGVDQKTKSEDALALHKKAYTLLDMLRERYGEKFKDKTLKTVKALGFSFYNLSRRFRAEKNSEGEKACLDYSGKLLYDFVMHAGEGVDERYLIAVADILYKRLKDYARSEEVTRRILEIIKKRVEGRFDPYDPETKRKLEEMRDKLFDRDEARDRWNLLVDRMYDGKDKEGKQITRKQFKTFIREAWPEKIGEKPYMYEEGYVWLSEAVMLELGYPEEKRKKLAAQRDSDKAEDVEAFWKNLFDDYANTLRKDPTYLKQVYNYLDNAVLVNNYKERLADCYFHNGKYKEALALYRELDDYYIFEPSTKAKLGETFLAMARKTDDPKEKKELAEKARLVYLWIKKKSPKHTREGRIDHFKAVFKIAECYEVEGKLEAARHSLIMELKYGSVPYPSEEYERKLKNLIEEYGKKVGQTQKDAGTENDDEK